MLGGPSCVLLHTEWLQLRQLASSTTHTVLTWLPALGVPPVTAQPRPPRAALATSCCSWTALLLQARSSSRGSTGPCLLSRLLPAAEPLQQQVAASPGRNLWLLHLQANVPVLARPWCASSSTRHQAVRPLLPLQWLLVLLLGSQCQDPQHPSCSPPWLVWLCWPCCPSRISSSMCGALLERWCICRVPGLLHQA